MTSILGRTVPLLVALGIAAPAVADTSSPREMTAPLAMADTRAFAGTYSLVEQAQRLEHGEGTARDLARAHELYCAAARGGDADAMIRLGWMYANGRGVARDDAYAHTLFVHASARGSDLGTRLAAAIRGDAERLPPCMTPPKAVERARAPAPAPSRVDPGPTPVVAQPAEFREAPRSVDWKKLVGTVVQMARDFRLDPRLVFALIRVESNFDPQARSPKNAQGLMQLIPETAERFAVSDVLDPVQNLRGGMSYLRWLLSYFKGDVVLTLAAYNAGEGAVIRHRGVPPYPETVAYVQRIRAFYPLDRHPFDPRIAQSNPPTGPRQAPTALR